MKLIKLYFWILIVFSSFALVSCSDDDNPVPDPVPDPDPLETAHFDIWVTTDPYGGGGSNVEATLVQSLKSLDEQKTITFDGIGIDVTAKLFQESVIKGQYYYQVPKEKDRIGKYKISSKGIEVIKEIPFKNNTLKDRRYSHTWIDDNTLVLMAANGDASKVIWIKIDADQMKIVSEGELNLPALPAGGIFSTSGMASYRKADNMIIYTYQNNSDKTHFYAAFVNAGDMSVKSTIEEDRAEQIGNSAYGELVTSKKFFDSEGNFYLVCANQIKGGTSTQQYSTILRINKGSYEFDKSYIGFQGKNYSRGKIVTIDYLTTGKALLYIQDPTHTGAAGWGSGYNCYYAVLDLTTDNLTELALPYCEGTLAQRSVILGNKAYIGVNPANPDDKDVQAIYIYDIKTGGLTKGITLKHGLIFQRIVSLED